MKKRLFKLFVVLSSAIILILLIFFTNGLDELVDMFKKAKLYWLAAAFGCMMVYWLFDAVLLHVITRGLLEKQPIKDTIRVTMIGQFFNAITPLSGAGQPVQAYVMVQDGIKPGHAASIILVKTFLHQLIIVFYTITAFALRGPLFGSIIPHFYYLYALGLMLNMAFLIFYALFIYKKQAARKVLISIFAFLKRIRIKKAENWQAKVEKELESFSEGAELIKSNVPAIIKLILSQILQFTFYFSIPYFIHLAVEPGSVNPLDMITAQSMIILISLLVPSPGATGGVESLSYMFYGIFFRHGYIIPVILVYRILTYYSSIIVGGLFTVFAPEKPLKHQE